MSNLNSALTFELVIFQDESTTSYLSNPLARVYSHINDGLRQKRDAINGMYP